MMKFFRGLWWKFTTRNHTCVTPRTLPKRYVEYIDLLPHVIFEILQRFVEEECGPNGCIDWDYDELHRSVRQEMDELLNWWKWFVAYDPYENHMDQLDACRPEFVRVPIYNGLSRVEQHYTSPEAEETYHNLLREIGEEQEKLYAQLTEKCKRVIELRGYYWT